MNNCNRLPGRHLSGRKYTGKNNALSIDKTCSNVVITTFYFDRSRIMAFCLRLSKECYVHCRSFIEGFSGSKNINLSAPNHSRCFKITWLNNIISHYIRLIIHFFYISSSRPTLELQWFQNFHCWFALTDSWYGTIGDFML